MAVYAQMFNEDDLLNIIYFNFNLVFDHIYIR
jgi:hypothetical protein